MSLKLAKFGGWIVSGISFLGTIISVFFPVPVPDHIKIYILSGFVLLLILVFVFIDRILNKTIVKYDDMIKMGKKLIGNASEKIIFMGGDISWIDQFSAEFEELKKKGDVSIEVFFDGSKYKNLLTTRKNEFKERMKSLEEFNAKICYYNTPLPSTSHHLGLRCIIVDPDDPNNWPDNMRVLHARKIKEKIYRIINASYNDKKSDYIAYRDIYGLIQVVTENKSWASIRDR